MTTGQFIKAAREKAGMTQKELADKLGIPYQSVSQWERNTRNPKYDTIRRIATALGVEWTDLVPEEEQGKQVIDQFKEKLSSDGKAFKKNSTEEAYRLGILNFSFKSDEDRIAYFYSLLNTDGKLVASKHFYQHLDKNQMGDVADYIEKLSKIPQYQRQLSQDTPTAPSEGKDTPASGKPPEGPQEGAGTD